MEPYSKTSQRGHRLQTLASAVYAGEDAWGGSDPLRSFAPVVNWTASLAGWKNPNWRLQVIRGESATTPMTAFDWEIIQDEPGEFEVIGNLGPGTPDYRKTKTCLIGHPLSTATLVGLNTVGISAGTAENDAVGAWYRKVRKKMGSFHGTVFAAESREAKRMIYERAQKMLTRIPAFQDLLRKRWVKSRTKKGKLKTLSNSWLELQFGWLPLASDIADLCKALQEPVPQLRRVRAEAVHFNSETNVLGYGGSGNAQWITAEEVWTRYHIEYTGCIQARASPAGSRLLDFGLGVREFLPTMWEVIPWSFAVDYFTNVSDIINSVSYASTKVNWCCRVLTQERYRTLVSNFAPIGTSSIPWIVRRNIPSTFEFRAKRVDRRNPLDGTNGYLDIPGLTFKLPSFKQVLNLAALAASKRLRLAY